MKKNDPAISAHKKPVPLRERVLRFGGRWSYSPAPEATSDVPVRPRYDLFIGGKFIKPLSGKYFPSINPANEEQLAEIAQANAADVERAVQAARGSTKELGARCPVASGACIFSASHVSSRIRSGNLPFSSRSMAARPFARAATSTCRWLRRIFLPCGLGGQTLLSLSRPCPASRWRRWSNHPVEFSPAHGGVEDRARSGLWQHLRFETRRDNFHHSYALGGNLRRG
jgi:hypothetical protein